MWIPLALLWFFLGPGLARAKTPSAFQWHRSFGGISTDLPDTVLQTSTNLSNWTSLQTNNAADGLANFTHANVAGLAARFYRAVQGD